MGKIISQTSAIETVHELTQEIEEVVLREVWNVEVNARLPRLTSVGYDDEIGLWEEQEHRSRTLSRQPLGSKATIAGYAIFISQT